MASDSPIWQDRSHDLDSLAALRSVYELPSAPATLDKEADFIHPLYRPFIEAAPFCVLATRGADGRLDTSPRGDARGQLLEIVDDGRTLLMPDRRGNNRIDSLSNIVVHDPAVALLFLIPGIGEAIRVMGQARVSVAPELLQRFAVDGDKLPRSVLVIAVNKVFFQCARAIKRSGLWDPAAQVERSSLPSTGSVLAGLSQGFDGEGYDAILQERQKATLY